eukprot:CAMPEP_0172474274 /NCGR_PEP_ID=MMETSP1065-20121228/69275_1 /TAXON_ID=265537 /ORGANISM="Amphiprora paludosa, Strain CCMP125" /LENGTH=1243 /DNA_ID=CAMNT_0013232453 /DNA_START=67 /DNA_END=3798 /DNA_ORIENTATION=-
MSSNGDDRRSDAGSLNGNSGHGGMFRRGGDRSDTGSLNGNSGHGGRFRRGGDRSDTGSLNGNSSHGGSRFRRGQGSDHGSNKLIESAQGVDKIAAEETKYLTISRILVIFVILFIAAIVSTGAYIFLDRSEQDNYDDRYEHVANTAKDAVEFHVKNVFKSASALSRTLSAEAKALKLDFPFVTYPTFETLCGNARDQGGYETLFYSPFVDFTDLPAWNNYSLQNQGWIQDSREVAIAYSEGELSQDDYVDESIIPLIYVGGLGTDVEFAPSYGQGPYMPLWMQSPPPFRPTVINFDSYNFLRITIDASIQARQPVMSEVQDLSLLAETVLKAEEHAKFHENILDTEGANTFDHPHSQMYTPIFEEPNDDSSKVVGTINAIVAWDRYMTDLLPEGTRGVYCVVKNTCDQAYTYKLNGNQALFVGSGDLHETKYDGTEVILPFYDLKRPNETAKIWGHCLYSYHLYASQEFEDKYLDSSALPLTLVVASTFFFIVAVFFLYDWFLKRRNSKILDVAAKTSAIVSSLFPSNVRDRLLNNAAANEKNAAPVEKNEEVGGKNRMKLKNFLQSEAEMDSLTDNNDTNSHDYAELHVYGSKPIADIFPETTIMFADIVGFTAWSSTREPTQVFTLLENIYKSFDDIATRRRVFKVETVGDCYVAVCGLPDPRSDHAVVMSRFARACLKRMQELVHKLEVMLGPDTADLSMRIGLHSGPVTAGVLRGERARFQLFGDTMNTASRMESTGEKGMIQMSQETADYLTVAGKGSWIFPRDEKVVAKGKGRLQTYWLASEGPEHHRTSSTVEEQSVEIVAAQPLQLDKSERLVKWNGDLLLKLLKEIEASRDPSVTQRTEESNYESGGIETRQGTVLDEVQEIVHLPNFASKTNRNANTIQLAPEVEDQLLSYIGAVAMLYQDNPFHCFEHASHVTMSVSKLMSRIIAPDLTDEDVGDGNMQALLHDHTYGITSDPLTQFACVFSALIHDVDHTGVPNNQLARENPRLAELYGGRSIAEQNSVDLAWNLLMGADFEALRNAIYKTPEEESRFRQLVVNSVMATDIMDKDLKQLRNQRWDRAFEEASQEESQKDAIDRKATIVIEHLIQASDVSHTMQHWHIYRKWNQRLFGEMYQAYVSGRSDRDPGEFWYKGELGFFDFYIIPLAKKLKDCGVFGVSSDEYLNYAVKNREEWEQRGQEVVAEMANELKTKYPSPQKADEPVKSSELEATLQKSTQNGVKSSDVLRRKVDQGVSA